MIPGQLFSYPPRRWRRETKPFSVFKKGKVDLLCETSSSVQASPAASGLIQTVEGKRSSRLATMIRGKDSTDSMFIDTCPISWKGTPLGYNVHGHVL